MTDEEKAIWKKSNEYLLDHFTQTFREHVHDDILKHLEESYANGYKNGLAEGKTKWHDLRKNPNDLPKENGEYYGKVNYFGEQSRNIFFVVDRKSFDVDCVLAWCELPKFEEQI